MNCNEIQELLHPLVDNELCANDKNVVTEHLAACSQCQREYALINDTRAKIALASRYRAPDSLAENIVEQIQARKRNKKPVSISLITPRWLRPLSTHAIAAICGGLLVFMLLQLFESPPQLQQQILSAHVRSLMDQNRVQIASGDTHTVAPWFSGKIDFAPKVKDLKSQGFILVGGRVDYLKDNKVAAIVYQRRKHVINLFITAKSNGSNHLISTAKTHWSRRGFNAVGWEDKEFHYWAISDLSSTELAEFSNLLINP